MSRRAPCVADCLHLLFEPKASDSAHGGEQLHPQGFFKFVTHKESIALCLHPLFNISPIQGSESFQLLTPAESTVANVTEPCRDDHFLECNTVEENFFANLRESW